MDTPSGVKDSIPAWIKFSVQAPGEIPYNGIYYDPPEEVCSRSYLIFFNKKLCITVFIFVCPVPSFVLFLIF